MSWPAWNSNIPLPAGNLSADMRNMGHMNAMSNLGPMPLLPNTGNMPNIGMPNVNMLNMGNMTSMGNMPNLSNMQPNAGSIGPDHWNAMQSAQWQQWAQWQQQYAQWHSQYGDKYVQQMQVGGGMGGDFLCAPAPPPPKTTPPPPPPHENDQPLYANKSAQSKPSPSASSDPPDQSQHYSNIPIASIKPITTTGNHSNWSQPSSTTPEGNGAYSKTDALNKLAEEKRLFDIQFKKWEQEIENWKLENVNHPDKKAYKDYEDTFEACRAQLLERRKQMDLRKAKLMGFSEQSNSAPTPGNSQLSNEAKPSEKFNDQNSRNSRSSDSQNKNADPEDRYSFYENPNNTCVPTGCTSPQSSNFLTTKDFNKGIPGLDLVPGSEKNQGADVIDITKAQVANKALGPDYSILSKGIDSILGDEKIMNILSMVRDQRVLVSRANNQPNQQSNNQNLDFQPNQQTSNSNFNNQPPNQPQNRQWKQNRGNNSYDNNDDMNFQNVNQQQGNCQGREGQQRLLPRQQQGPQGSQQRGHQGNQQLGPQANQQLGPQGNQQLGLRGNQQQGPWGNEQFGPRGNQQQGPQGNQQQGPQGNQQQGPQGNQHQGPWGNEQFGSRGNQQQGPQGNQHQGPRGSDQFGPWGNQQQGPQGNQHQGPWGNEQFGSRGNQQQGPQGNQQQGPRGTQQLGPQVNEQHGPRGNPQQGPRGNQPQGPRGNQPQGPRGNQQQGSQGNQRNMQRNVNMMGQQFQNNFNKNSSLIQNPPHNQMPQGYNRNFQDNENNYNHQEYSDNYDGNRVQPNVPIRPKGLQRPPQNMMQQQQQNQLIHEAPIPASKPVWREDTIFTPSLIVDYEHKPLRLKAREFIEPVHTFDYKHKPKFEEEKRREYSEIASRRPSDDYNYLRDRGRNKQNAPLRERDYDRRQLEPADRRYNRSGDVRRLDSRPMPSRYNNSTSQRNRDSRDRGSHERNISRVETRTEGRGETRTDGRGETRTDGRGDTRTDGRGETRTDGRGESRTDSRTGPSRNRSRERDSLKRTNINTDEKSQPDKKQTKLSAPRDIKNILMLNDLIESPGREVRPRNIAIILRGLPGSGKSYLAKLIRDREAVFGTSIRIMSIDDYFTQDIEVEQKDPATGKMVRKNVAKYEYDPKLEPLYLESLKRAFKKTLSDGYFSFLIFDAANPTPECYFDILVYARHHNFQAYVCSLDVDPLVCHKRNIHNRSLDSIKAMSREWGPTPSHHLQLDPTALLQNVAITEVTMEDVDNCVIIEDDDDDVEVDASVTSKWEKMDDVVQLARLDGTSRPLRPSTQLSMEEYLQLDEWQPTKSTPGKKTVRWADIEESRQQEKMRAIGFVVGQTDWNRMTDHTMGSSALTKTKYIERVRRH